MRSLWRCPRCGRRFARKAGTCGPVTVVPEKTRIAFQVRMSFAAVMLKKRRLDGHVVLARRLEDPRFRAIQTISPGNHVHQFRIETPDQLDDRVREWLCEAYAVGEQRHLRAGEGPPRARGPTRRSTRRPTPKPRSN
jgi:hypothetical protein